MVVDPISTPTRSNLFIMFAAISYVRLLDKIPHSAMQSSIAHITGTLCIIIIKTKLYPDKIIVQKKLKSINKTHQSVD